MKIIQKFNLGERVAHTEDKGICGNVRGVRLVLGRLMYEIEREDGIKGSGHEASWTSYEQVLRSAPAPTFKADKVRQGDAVGTVSGDSSINWTVTRVWAGSGVDLFHPDRGMASARESELISVAHNFKEGDLCSVDGAPPKTVKIVSRGSFSQMLGIEFADGTFLNFMHATYKCAVRVVAL